MNKVYLTREDFLAFARVRKSGDYKSMYDSNARHAAKLSKEKWLEIIKQYKNLEIPRWIKEDTGSE